MYLCKKGILITFLFVICTQLIKAEPDPNFHIYLLFGQSNMAGGGAGNNDGEGNNGVGDYCDTTSRVKVMAFTDCSSSSYPCPNMQINRTHNQWYTAFPPYHNCHEGIGPADGFGHTLLDSIREDITIGFIPCALSGEKIEVFQKGVNYPIDSWTQPTVDNGQKLSSGGYEWMVKRAKIAQESGVIKGILLHQGEANSGQQDWPNKVKGIIDDLKQDLDLWDSIPFIVGELRYDGCCPSHNPIINKLPDMIPNCAVASAEGLERRLSRTDGQYDQYHFSTQGFKDFGFRFAEEFLKLSDQEWIPRIGTVAAKWQPSGALTVQQVIQRNEMVNIFSLDGKKVLSIQSKNINSAKNMLQSGKVYLLKWNTTGRCNTMVGF